MEFFIRQMLKAMGVFARTVKAFFTRRVASVITWFRQVTNVSRGAVTVANSALQSATNVAKTPSKREDYIAFGNLLVAKSLLARLAVALAALILLVYFILWPFFLSHFLTARFWTEDARVADWTGRVIVFEDKKKTIPLYAGRLEHGLLQGDGKEYGEEGVLAYEGTFVDGLRSGTGTAYDNGVLCYEGQFSQGFYEGTGTTYAGGKPEYVGQFSAGKYHGRGTLYQAGSLLYDGQFDQGQYQGQGALYQAGTLEYQGTFRSGVPEGTGTSYYYGGGVKYEGQFEKGIPEGTGKFYEDDRLVYQGQFSKGLYNGTGTLYPAPGEQIDAAFLNGEPDGIVRWSKGGKLYYEGEWAEDRPEGYGVLYAKSGESAFQGAFARGTIDGSRLLGLVVDDLRKALGESVSTAGRGNTFSVSSQKLGLSAQCTYQTDSAEAQVVSVYLFSPEDGENWFRLLPGMDRAAFPTENAQRGSLSYTRQDAVPLPSGEYSSTQVSMESGTETILYQRQAPVVVRWTASGAGFTPQSGDTGSIAVPVTDITGMDALEELLASIDSMADAPAALEPVAYGDTPVGEALAACASMDQAAELIGALSDFWLQAETENLLADNLSRARTLLADAEKQQAMGQGGGADALREEVRSLESQILNCEIAKQQAESGARAAGGGDPAQLDLSETQVMFSPTALDISELPLVAAAYAQITGGGTDPAELTVSVRSSILQLQESYESVQAAVQQYEDAVKASDDAAKEYAMGTGTKADWYAALSAKNNARAEVNKNTNTFTKQSADLNSTTGGWVSRSTGWHESEFESALASQLSNSAPNTASGTAGVTAAAGSAGDFTTGSGQEAPAAETALPVSTGDASESAGGGTASETAPAAAQESGTASETAPASDQESGAVSETAASSEMEQETAGTPSQETAGTAAEGTTGAATGETSGTALEGTTGGTSGETEGETAGRSSVSGLSSSGMTLTPEEWDAVWGAPEG